MFTSAAFYTLIALPLVPVVYFLIAAVRWISYRRKIKAEVDKLPGPKQEPFFGNIRQIPIDGPARKRYFRRMVKRYKTLYRIQFGPTGSSIMVWHPDSIKKVLQNGPPKLTYAGAGYGLLLPWLGNGLLINHGDGWFRNRRLLTPAFHFDVLKPYMKVYNESADIFLEKISNNLDRKSNGESLEIYRDVGLCTLNVMMRCAFSYDEDVQREGADSNYVKAVESLTMLLVKRFFNPLLYLNRLYFITPNGRKFAKGCRYAHKVAYQLINKRKKDLARGETVEDIKSKRAIDFLDILLLARDENGEGLSDLEIRCEVDTFLFEGHDTTASAISWCIYHLACHPEYQQRAREEVIELLEGRQSSHITWDDLSQLPYLTMCVKESMRYTPPVPMVIRELEKPLELEGVTLLPGTPIAINIDALHHNPSVWGEDHEVYNPDRFLHENMKNMDSHAYLPFSAGARNCIGQNFAMNEIKTVIARVLHSFVLKPDDENPPEVNATIVMRSDNGIHIKFIPR